MCPTHSPGCPAWGFLCCLCRFILCDSSLIPPAVSLFQKRCAFTLLSLWLRCLKRRWGHSLFQFCHLCPVIPVQCLQGHCGTYFVPEDPHTGAPLCCTSLLTWLELGCTVWNAWSPGTHHTGEGLTYQCFSTADTAEAEMSTGTMSSVLHNFRPVGFQETRAALFLCSVQVNRHVEGSGVTPLVVVTSRFLPPCCPCFFLLVTVPQTSLRNWPSWPDAVLVGMSVK